MRIGTKSVLFGVHCFLLHPWFVAIAWIKLYGFPFDPRIWIAFFVHDLGYWGKPNMDGLEGEMHVELGAKIMGFLFDKNCNHTDCYKRSNLDNIRDYNPRTTIENCHPILCNECNRWRNFSMYHSRYYAKKYDAQPSKLCFADKLSFIVTPRWLYLLLANVTGEINEYLENAKKSETNHWQPVEGQKKWHNQLCEYMTKWVEEHKDGSIDTWTISNRNKL